MKTIYNWTGCSGWTNSSKSMAVHITVDGSNPLCGKIYKCGTLDKTKLNLAEVTCKKCLSLYKKKYMKHHKLIQSLINEIRSQREQILEIGKSYLHHEIIMEQRNQQLRDENERIERQRESERNEELSNQWRREDSLNKLEKQDRYGDEYGASQTKKELKNSQ